MYRRGARSIPPLGHSQQPSRLSKRILQGNQSRRTCTLQRPRMHATQHTSHQLQRRRHALRVPGRVRQHCAAPASARARYHHPAAQVCVPGVAAQLRCPGGNPETVRDHGPCQRPRTGSRPHHRRPRSWQARMPPSHMSATHTAGPPTCVHIHSKEAGRRPAQHTTLRWQRDELSLQTDAGKRTQGLTPVSEAYVPVSSLTVPVSSLTSCDRVLQGAPTAPPKSAAHACTSRPC